ncbi:MAG TPA: four-carbon acid sugar kinase family protein [Marinilabiliaceae bacterium]|nr:four-carbon acid sugar kinase family protein [Marinilabiliaceae bacterium]
MAKTVLIADDLTGANATGVLLASQGLKTATYLNLDNVAKQDQFDVISVTTDSRGKRPGDAYNAVAKVASFFKDKDIDLFCKRIDSTLRGNIGAEIDAVLDSLDGGEIALVVASFPASGRICSGGYLLVDSIPLEKTGVATDPKTPVNTSHVVQLISSQTKQNVGYISLGEVLRGQNIITERLIQEKNNGKRIIVIDAVTNEEISEIANAAFSSGLPIITVDPGPFSCAYAQLVSDYTKPSKAKSKVMFVIGSVTKTTERQLNAFYQEYNPLIITVDPQALVYSDRFEGELRKAESIFSENIDQYDIFGLTTNGVDILNLKEISYELGEHEDMVAQRIASGLAKIAKRILDRTQCTIGGLYTSGGDTTVEVCKLLQASGIEVIDEVLPLAAYGYLINGQYHHTPIVTKGGLVGKDTAMIHCIDYLFAK